MKKSVTFALILFLFFSAFLFAEGMPLPSLTARSAVIVRNIDGAILYGKAPLSRLPPASTAKVMTVLIALETLDMGKEVRISSKAANTEPTKLWLAEGEIYAGRDLIKAALINSANDAAVAIAEAVSGTEEKFARVMNKKAAELNMKDTFFTNATGLPDEREPYTTVYDLTILMREAGKNSLFVKIANLKEAAIEGTNGRKFYLKNHNKMLWRGCSVIGKTGYTRKARHCFAGLDTSSDNPVAFAMLGSRSLWRDVENMIKISKNLKK